MSREQKDYISLSDHTFRKGVFYSPFGEEPFSLIEDAKSWVYGRAPEYLWLALLFDEEDRQRSIDKISALLKFCIELCPQLISPKWVDIQALEPSLQKILFNYIKENFDNRTLFPITVFAPFSDMPELSLAFFNEEKNVESRVAVVTDALTKLMNPGSTYCADIRYCVLLFAAHKGTVHIREGLSIVSLLKDYPTFSHDDERMRMARPAVRLTEQMLFFMEDDVKHEEYLDLFWKRVSELTKCDFFYVSAEEAMDEEKEYINAVKQAMDHFNRLSADIAPFDDKLLVLTGLASYSYRALREISEHRLRNTISGRLISRLIAEALLNIQYFTVSEKDDPEIWKNYKEYGIGQYKLVLSRIRESPEENRYNHINEDYLELLVNEYSDERFMNMNTSYFMTSARDKGRSTGLQHLYGNSYDYDSSFNHCHWGAIRESTILKCNNPSHKYHCVPDIEEEILLPDVWSDCVFMMNIIIGTLEELFGLPEDISKAMSAYE